MRNLLGCGVAVAILGLTTTAMAQEPTPPPTEPIVQPKANATVTTQVSTTTTAPVTSDAKKKDDDNTTDHEKVIGHFGVGYFGVTAQPIGQGTSGNVSRGTVQVPIIGMRYWLMERIGIDAGLGLNFFSNGTSTDAAGKSVSTDGAAVSAFAVHAGLPIAFAYGKHYKFLVIPEANFGFATQTEAAQNVTPPAVAQPDIHHTGIRLDVGARIGTEIQFGFIGIPELALQASVGLNVRYRNWSTSQDTSPTTSQSTHELDFGTTVQSDPWAIFTNNIAAIYYFP